MRSPALCRGLRAMPARGRGAPRLHRHARQRQQPRVRILGGRPGHRERARRPASLPGSAKIIVSSSGAAYGYHPDNPAWIGEDQPIRGNQVFAYAWHKRLVEEMLARWRTEHPELKQVVFRIGTILGATVKNQITDLFEKPRPIAILGSDSPFVFIWDQDVVGCILHAVSSGKTGIFNVAGRWRADDPRDRRASRQALPGAAGLGLACCAGSAEVLAPDPVRSGAAGLPALPAGARRTGS